MRHLAAAAALALLCGLTAAACGGIADPSDNVQVDFTGTVEPLGGRVHEFDVTPKQGEYSARITALAPTQSALLSIHLGSVINGACVAYVNHIGVAVFNRDALSGQINKGHYCIQVYDQGSLTVAHTYTLHVSHP